MFKFSRSLLLLVSFAMSSWILVNSDKSCSPSVQLCALKNSASSDQAEAGLDRALQEVTGMPDKDGLQDMNLATPTADHQLATTPDTAEEMSSAYPVMTAASAGLPSPAAVPGGLTGATVSATLNFEPGSLDNLFDCGNYYVPAGFKNSYPHPPTGIVVTDTAGAGNVEFGFADDISSWSVDLSTTGLISITSTVQESGTEVSKAVVRISSDALSMPQYGGVLKVSDTFTNSASAALQPGVLVLEVHAAHIDDAGTFTAVFQLVACNPGAPCCDDQGSLRTQGTFCRSAPGPCAEPASCSGTSPDCPNHQMKPAGTVCGSSRACSQQPFCTGNSPTCPVGSNRPDRTPCLKDDKIAEYPIAQAGRMSLDSCSGKCQRGVCQLKLNRQGCCYTSDKMARKTVKTVHCWK